MLFKQIPLLTILSIMSIITPSAFSENEDSNLGIRRGFVIGIGTGVGLTSYTQTLVEYWGNEYKGPVIDGRGIESAFVTHFKMGHGFTNKFLLYYSSKITWVPLQSLYKNTVVANGTAGVGFTYYPSHNFGLYITGSVGYATLATWFPPIELQNARATGLAASVGIGLEFHKHYSVEFTVNWGNATATTFDNKIYYDITNELVNIAITLNVLGY